MGAAMMPRRPRQQDYVYRHGACGHYYIPVGFPVSPSGRPSTAPVNKVLGDPMRNHFTATTRPAELTTGPIRAPLPRPRTSRHPRPWGGGTYGTTWDEWQRTLTRSCLQRPDCFSNSPADTHIQDLVSTRWLQRKRWQHDDGTRDIKTTPRPLFCQ